MNAQSDPQSKVSESLSPGFPQSPQSTPLVPAIPAPALAIPAIALCAKAWEDAFRAQLEQDGDEDDAITEAGKAYRAALPPLNCRDDCRDFIACVAHGMLLGAIPENNAGKLLYAAQVACSSPSELKSDHGKWPATPSTPTSQNPKPPASKNSSPSAARDHERHNRLHLRYRSTSERPARRVPQS